MKTKLPKTLGVLFKTRYFLNGKALYLIFNIMLMSNVRYTLIAREEKIKNVYDINVLINRALRCIHYKKHDDGVRELKLKKNLVC